MATFAYKCPHCGLTQEVNEGIMRGHIIPHCCGETMKRDYKAESAIATFKGGGWARSSK